MTRTTSTRAPIRAAAGAFALIAVAALATAACGREGGLERPGPMFGLARADEQPQRPTGAPSAAERNAAADAAKAGNATGNSTDASDDNNVPTTKRDIRDPAQRLTPLSVAPLPGLNDPLGPPVSTKPPG